MNSVTFHRPDVRTYYVLHYVNGDQYLGRFDGRWTRTVNLDSAALFESAGEAENARQALLDEAEDRVRDKVKHAAPMWWDFHGGLVLVARVERILQFAKDPSGAAQEDQS